VALRMGRAGWRRPVVGLGVAAGLWGVAVSGTKFALGGFDPVSLLCVELVAATVVLWVVLVVRGYRPPGSWWLPVLLGLLEPALAYLGDTVGLSLTSAVHGAVIGGLESALVVALAAVLLRERVSRPAVAAVGVAAGGLVVLAGAGGGRGTAAGDLLVAGGMASAALYTIVARRFDDGSDALSLTAWQFTVATAVCVLVTAVRWGAGGAPAAVPGAARFWVAAVLVGVAGFGLSFLLFNHVIVRVEAGRAAIVLNLIPVFGVASAVLFLREGITARDTLGALLIAASVLYFTITSHHPTPATTTPPTTTPATTAQLAGTPHPAGSAADHAARHQDLFVSTKL
jgi:O-acetylserine/cysteine efflux transporter